MGFFVKHTHKTVKGKIIMKKVKDETQQLGKQNEDVQHSQEWDDLVEKVFEDLFSDQ